MTAMAMRTAETTTHTVVLGGWARSGKGTTGSHLRDKLQQLGKRVELIDQGIKYRAIGAIASKSPGNPLDSPAALNDFIQSKRAQESVLALLAEVPQMDEATKKAVLYSPALSRLSGRVGQVPASHQVALGLLKAQMQTAVEAQTDLALIDGRSMEKYARKFEAEGLARFAIGLFFTCDPAVAARRSLGLFGELDELTAQQKESLLTETFNISDRNRRDTLREVDPMREPRPAYALDLHTYGQPDSDTPYKIAYDIMRRDGMVTVDASYTNSVQEMTGPIEEIAMHALFFRGALSHDAGIDTDHL